MLLVRKTILNIGSLIVYQMYFMFSSMIFKTLPTDFNSSWLIPGQIRVWLTQLVNFTNVFFFTTREANFLFFFYFSPMYNSRPIPSNYNKSLKCVSFVLQTHSDQSFPWDNDLVPHFFHPNFYNFWVSTIQHNIFLNTHTNVCMYG